MFYMILTLIGNIIMHLFFDREKPKVDIWKKGIHIIINSVINIKIFSLGEGLAELFAPEIKNLEAFKASVQADAKCFLNMFLGGHEKTEGYDKFEKSSGGGGFDQDCYDKASK